MFRTASFRYVHILEIELYHTLGCCSPAYIDVVCEFFRFLLFVRVPLVKEIIPSLAGLFPFNGRAHYSGPVSMMSGRK